MARPVTGEVTTELSRNFGGADIGFQFRLGLEAVTVSGTTKSSGGEQVIAFFACGRSGLRAISTTTSYVETGLGQLHPR